MEESSSGGFFYASAYLTGYSNYLVPNEVEESELVGHLEISLDAS